MDVNIYMIILYKYMKTQKNRFSLGGEAIASGTYGCVFSPPLKCKGDKRPNGKVVSKLLTNTNADEEFNEASKIKSILKKISRDYKRYFIFPKKPCKPETLKEDDLNNFEKCTNLTNNPTSITKENINNNLDSVSILELTNGGYDLESTIKDIEMTEIGILNESIIDLLKNAVVTMIEGGIVHFDLKSSNLLIDDDSQLRIIDWGLASISKKNELPDYCVDTFQFNAPFGNVLICNSTVEYINEELSKINYKETIKPLKPVLREIIWGLVSGKQLKSGKQIKSGYQIKSGHIGHIAQRYETHLNDGTHNNKIPVEILMNVYNLLTDHLTEAVLCYINPTTYEFDATKYYNEVLTKNGDIWGALTIYDDILQQFENIQLPDNLKQLRVLILRYLYSDEFAGKPIDISKLVDELNGIFQDSKKPSSGSRKTSYFSKKPSSGTRKPSYFSKKPSSGSRKSSHFSKKPSSGTRKPSYFSKKPSSGSRKSSHFSKKCASQACIISGSRSSKKTVRKRCKNRTKRYKNTH
jgi:hypothetical protein